MRIQIKSSLSFGLLNQAFMFYAIFPKNILKNEKEVRSSLSLRKHKTSM